MKVVTCFSRITFPIALFTIFFFCLFFFFHTHKTEYSFLEKNFFPTASAGFDTNTLSAFTNYDSWDSSSAPKEQDSLYKVLNLFGALYSSATDLSTKMDINGDGLEDLVWHSGTSSSTTKRFGIFLNKGNLGYDLVYKCAYNNISEPRYYGDCADSSRNEVIPFGSMFTNYTSWVTSHAPKDDDLIPQVLGAMSNVYNSRNYTSFLDFNGDGLMDFVYQSVNSSPNYYGIFLNRGDFQFDFAYKCVYQYQSGEYTYYGDCADTSRSENLPFTQIYDISSLPESENLNSEDTIAQVLYQTALNTSDGSYGRIDYSFNDVNGDGLTDVLKHSVPAYMPTQYFFGVFINRGDLHFDLQYKCLYRDLDGLGNGTVWHYFGDCAAP